MASLPEDIISTLDDVTKAIVNDIHMSTDMGPDEKIHLLKDFLTPEGLKLYEKLYISPVPKVKEIPKKTEKDFFSLISDPVLRSTIIEVVKDSQVDETDKLEIIRGMLDSPFLFDKFLNWKVGLEVESDDFLEGLKPSLRDMVLDKISTKEYGKAAMLMRAAPEQARKIFTEWKTGNERKSALLRELLPSEELYSFDEYKNECVLVLMADSSSNLETMASSLCNYIEYEKTEKLKQRPRLIIDNSCKCEKKHSYVLISKVGTVQKKLKFILVNTNEQEEFNSVNLELSRQTEISGVIFFSSTDSLSENQQSYYEKLFGRENFKNKKYVVYNESENESLKDNTQYIFHSYVNDIAHRASWCCPRFDVSVEWWADQWNADGEETRRLLNYLYEANPLKLVSKSPEEAEENRKYSEIEITLYKPFWFMQKIISSL